MGYGLPASSLGLPTCMYVYLQHMGLHACIALFWACMYAYIHAGPLFTSMQGMPPIPSKCLWGLVVSVQVHGSPTSSSQVHPSTHVRLCLNEPSVVMVCIY